MKRLALFLVLTFVALFTSVQSRAEINILLLGSTHSYSDNHSGNSYESAVVSEKAFHPAAIATELQSILANDTAIAGNVNVVFEDIYRKKQVDTAIGGSGDIWDFTYYCFSLMQYYMWPEGKTIRLDNLRGANGTNWNYVVLMGDPYLMANMPGAFAEGVRLVANEVASGSAEPILLAQWPENSSSFTATGFNEVVYRVGESANIRVVPAGKAWSTLSPQDTSTSHPTPHGAYLAASAIYSALYDKSAKSSDYTYDDAIADHALSVVQANEGAAQYAGTYTNINPFQMSDLKKRLVTWGEHGSSTEEGFAGGLYDAFASCKVNYSRTTPSASNPVDFSYSRGTDAFEPDKQYDYLDRLNYDDHTYGFPMGDHATTGAETMRYGIDKRYYGDYWFYNGTDLGVAYSMVMSNQAPLAVRGIPVRLIWSKMHHANVGLLSHRDTWHLSYELDRGVGAFMYTLLSGRCPVGEEPADDTSTEWKYWFCQKIGYETAWQMSHLTTRAPGFRVLPTSATATNVTPTVSQTLSVQFMMAPTSDVTVTVAPSDAMIGLVYPTTLTFTPGDYTNAQTVTVQGQTGPGGAYGFDVVLTTTSDDLVYDGLSDSWDFMNTRPEGPLPSDIRILGNGNMVFAGDMTPELGNGTDFGVVSSSASQLFTIENVSDTNDLVFTDTPPVVLTGGSGHFSITTNAAASSLAPGATTTFEITFAPLASGTHTAMVSVASSDSTIPVYSFALVGIMPSGPVVDDNGFTPESITSATVNGTLSTGVLANAWLCWGNSDGGTSTGSWDYVVSMGEVEEGVPFSTLVSGLARNTSYAYRWYVTNAIDAAWSDVASFYGTPGYYVTYDGNGNDAGATPVDGALYPEAATVTVSGNINGLTKTGHVFDRWNTTPEGDGTDYEPGATFAMGSADVTLYAQYLPKTIPFSDDFELRTLGLLDGQNGWSASDAMVQTNEAFDAQAVSIDSDSGFVTRTFGDNQTNVWTDFHLQPIFSPEDIPAPAPDETVQLYFDIDGHPVVYDGTNRTVISGSSISSGQWVRVTIHSDYAARQWNLYLDGDSVATNLAFYNDTATVYQELSIKTGSATAGTKLDNVFIGLISPLGSLSSDYAAWLQEHYGSTGVDDSQICSNGINTIREAYIIGLNPTNTTTAVFEVYGSGASAGSMVLDWYSTSGRVYNIYWSSNLLDGADSFRLLHSNIPWYANSFTNTEHSTREQGFYRIDVQLE